MNIYRRIELLLIMLQFSILSSQAQQHSIRELKEVFEKINALQVYSYDTEVSAVFPDGSRQQTKMSLSMDRPGHRLYLNNQEQTILVTPQWAFQAYHSVKKASVFDVVKYNRKYKETLPELQKLFDGNMMALFVDSILLKMVTLQSVKTNGNLVTYEVTFPPESMAKGITIIFNKVTGLPQTITMRTFQPTVEGRHNKSGAGTTIETTCRNYSRQLQEQKLDPKNYFRVSGGKATLMQYKNYQLTTIL